MAGDRRTSVVIGLRVLLSRWEWKSKGRKPLVVGREVGRVYGVAALREPRLGRSSNSVDVRRNGRIHAHTVPQIVGKQQIEGTCSTSLFPSLIPELPVSRQCPGRGACPDRAIESLIAQSSR